MSNFRIVKAFPSQFRLTRDLIVSMATSCLDGVDIDNVNQKQLILKNTMNVGANIYCMQALQVNGNFNLCDLVSVTLDTDQAKSQ